MGTIFGADDRPSDDLTARARIRDAALAQFAEHGTRGATMKGIADAAGVSTGLVQHHFGTKAGLRAACDEAVVGLFRREVTRSSAEGTLGDPGVMAALLNATPLVARYLARAIAEGEPAMVAVVDQLMDGAEEFLGRTWPDRFPPGSRRARDAAAVMAAMHGGTLVMHDHLARRMGSDPFEGRDPTRVGRAMLDVYGAMGEFVGSETGTAIREALDAYDDGSATEEERS
ncbi:TetR/AcrR family transcriptional regulator [Nocardiopsis sp. NPDC050513]|uniref:TetR/AcrR family transcriptional regulator n=1 Tax=Nocardiopsis sp. NPDC050513 TaxID=3364338 RepID=UPI003799D05A